jgi:protoheme IX farnesyltransferase
VSRALDGLRLTKPGVTALVLATCATGLAIAPAKVSAVHFALTIAGTGLLVGSANTLNMWMERSYDARMERTRDRPLPSGRLHPNVALAFGLVCAIAGTAILALVAPLACALGVFSLGMYVLVYTPLKRRSCLSLIAGAIPGALPPVMGLVSATRTIHRSAVLLFLVLFFWQVVHAGAIGVFRAHEYAAAGMKVVAVERGERVARAVITVHAGLLVAATLLAPSFGIGGSFLRAAAAVLGCALLAIVVRPSRATDVWAKRVFAASNLYLAALLVLSIVDHMT